MHLKTFVLLCFASSVLADDLFTHFQNKFNQNYSFREYVERKAVFQANVRKITEHNELFAKGQVSYMKGINQFTDLTEEEFQAQLTGERDKMTMWISKGNICSL